MSILKVAALFFVLSAAAAQSAPPQRIDGSTPLRIDGIGPIRVGMTLAEAQRATGMKFTDPDAYDGSNDTKSCTYVHFVDGPRRVSFMLLDGKIGRIDVWEPTTNRTAEGLGIGAAEAKILDLYRRANITITPSFYGGADRGREFTIDIGSGDMRYFFETDFKKVTGMRIGNKDAVAYVEGCL